MRTFMRRALNGKMRPKIQRFRRAPQFGPKSPPENPSIPPYAEGIPEGCQKVAGGRVLSPSKDDTPGKTPTRHDPKGVAESIGKRPRIQTEPPPIFLWIS